VYREEVKVEELSAPARGGDSLVTLTRGLGILEALAGASATRGLDHAALARRLGFARSTLYRYLGCLQQAGFVEESDEPGRYRLGPRILYLAAVMHRREFNDFARDHVRELARVTGETAHATVYDYPYSVTILIADGDAPVGPRVLIGSRRPLHASASGKLFLAHEQPRVIDAYLGMQLEARTQNTITHPDALRRLLVDVREQGYAVDQAESYTGICGLAAPVFDFSGEIVGTLCTTVATARLEPERIRQLAVPLRRSAEALSTRLGWVELERTAER
jgi:IclR family acetate operon transcriptional repressor